MTPLPHEDSPRRLDFGIVQHCGSRRKELQTLLSYVSNPTMDDGTNRPASMWIEAEPGVGKSNLMAKFRDTITTGTCSTSSTMTSDATHANTLLEADTTTNACGNTSDNHHCVPPNLPPCVCVQGKFEERAAASEPFAAFGEAMGELVQVLLGESPAALEAASWAKGIREALDTELPLLLGILPILRPLTDGIGMRQEESKTQEEEDQDNHDDDDDDQEDAFGDFSSREWRFERFRFAFRGLLRHVCRRLQERNNTHLVLLLDDLHWIDPDSLQIIKTLLEDKRRPQNLLLVAATRPIDQYDILLKFRDALLRQQDGLDTSNNTIQPPPAANTTTPLPKLVKTIGVTHLSIGEIEEVLVELLQQCSGTTASITNFAKLVKDKTQGNFFVVMQFLRLLERSHHIVFDNEQQKWTFDLDNITAVDFVSENVSEMVAQNIEATHGRRRSALMVAASFGVSQFDVSTIVHAVTVFEESDESKEPDDEQEEEEENMHDSMYEDPYVVSQRMSDMKEELSEAACDGFVEETAPGHYRFAHDRIRESAYSLLPSGDSRKQVHLRVGRQLRGWMDTSSELGLTQGFSKESLLLHAAKQSNLGADLIDDEWELLDLAELNYQAAELAARKAAFYSAMEYLQVGFSHLGDAKKAWSNHYDLALKFNVALARMQYCCGLLDESWETSEMVLQHGKSFRDKSGMYFCRLLSLTQQERADDALSLVLDVLQMTGKPFPRRYLILHCIRAYFKTARFMKESPLDYFVNLPISNDEDFRIYAAFMTKLLEISYYAGYLTYFFLVTCRGLESLAEGKDHSISSFDIMGWAMVEMSMGDIKAASRHCKLIEAQVAKHRQASPLNAVRGDVGLCSFLRIWTQPIRIDLTLLEESFRSIWVCGAVDIALLESPPLFAQLFASGVPLPKVAGYCDKYAEVAVDYKQMKYWYMNAPVYQAVLNLQGNSENPAVLKGNHIAETKESFLETCTKTANKPAIFQFQIWSACIAYHFRDYQRAKRCIKSMGSDLFEDGPIVWVQYRVFYTGLVYFALFKETRKSKYRRRALAAHRKLKDWVAQGVVNCEYMCLLLESEDLSSGRSTQLARTTAAYEDAIRVVSEAGLCHHHALAQELAGDFLYLQDKGSSPAKQYLSAAVKLYEEWGAAAKVSDIKKRCTNVDLSGTQGNAVP